jgi:hypothetical protein
MVVRVESEYYGGEEKAVVIKMFPQEFDIFELGLAISSLAPTRGNKPANIVNARIMQSFKQIVDQIIEQSTPRATDSENYCSPGIKEEDDANEEEDDDMIKVELDEFHGVETFEAPKGKDPVEFLKQEKKRLNLKNDTDLEDLLNVWLRDPIMRNKIKLADAL